MKGTALAQFIKSEFQERLLKLHNKCDTKYSVILINDLKSLTPSNFTKYKRLKDKKNSLYGSTAYYLRGTRKPVYISLDGACGFESIQSVLNHFRYRAKYAGGDSNNSYYTIVKHINHRR